MAPFQGEHSAKTFQNVNSKSQVTEGIPGRSGYGRESVGIKKHLRVLSNFIFCFSLNNI